MKVAQINFNYNSGSIGRIAHDLHEQMVSDGIDSHIFCAFDQTHAPECTSYMTNFGLRVNQVENRLLGNQGFGLFTRTKSLVKDLELFAPDVIHLHNLHAFYLNCDLLFSFLKSYNRPIIWTFHDCWPFTGHCAYFDEIGCDKWKKGCGQCPSHLSSYPNSLVDRTSKFFNLKKEVFNSLNKLTIVTPSKWLGELVRQSFLSKHHIEVINNGIDLSKFNVLNKDELKNKYGYKGKKVLLGVSSMGFCGRKGLNDFISISDSLPDEYQIILIGANKNDLKIMPGKIVAKGRTESIYQLNEYYSMADLFLNPTHEDNFPTTNIESLACGTPVITYPTGGSPESVSKSCGVVTKTKSAQAIVDAVLNYKYLENQSEECRRRAEQLYTKELFSSKYINLYKSCIIR